MKNPWLGLLSYQDPQKTDDHHVFCGRDAAVSSLFAMIDNNLLVTLYGKTGIGKTSVLNAGVFPLLRSRGYMPISIRLGKYDSLPNCSFAKYIIHEIQNEISSNGGSVETKFPEFVETKINATEYLWKYFCTSRFKDKEGNEIYPVVTLDQFEEIFISMSESASTLLRQIYALIDDNREIPDSDGYNDSTNFRFVFSIREDDLFYLEDAIDMHHLAEMKQNRYRLVPLTDSEAKEVIMLGGDSLENGTEDEIIGRIIRMSKDETGQISTNILSLTCCQLFIQLKGNITLKSLTETAKNPLDAFYTSCLEHISDSTRKYIEEELVDSDRRKFVSKSEFFDKVGKNDANTLMNGQYRIIQDITAGNRECVELIHDSLAKTICHMKTEAAERARNQQLEKHNRWIKRGLYALAVFLIAAIAVITMLFINNQKYKDEKGYGISQKISITFQEDSLIASNREFWNGSLFVIALNENSQDTLINRRINKVYIDSTLYVTLDTAKSLRICMTFNELVNYHNVDTTFKIGYLTDSPNIRMPIRKILPPQIEYSSHVVATIRGNEYNVQDAIVIIGDKIQRTDANGLFTFKLNDSLDISDVIYIVKKGYSCYERNDFVRNGKLVAKFELTPSDSLTTLFEMECERFDTLKNVKWYYRTPSSGEKVYYFNESTDRLVFYGTSKGLTSDGRISIWGYYYFQREYETRGHLAYHIFTGWMESGDMLKDKTLKSKSYEIDSYDFANNPQTIRGLFDRTGKLSGEISNTDGPIAVFGSYKEKE